MAQLTDRQVKLLASPIDPGRVARDGKGFSHLQVWDVRRYLNRVFGFAGWGEDITDVTLISERSVPNGTDRFKYTIIYRVTTKLSLYATDGTLLTSYSGSAVGQALNQPSLADAHDLALKTAASQALKRAAHNLGDQFGLSLYNGGDTRPVVNWSVAYPKVEEVQPDPPVKADPEEQGASPEEEAAAPVQNRPEPSSPVQNRGPIADTTTVNTSGDDLTMDALLLAKHSAPPEGVASVDAAILRHTTTYDQMRATAQQVQFFDALPAQFASTFGVPITEGTTLMYREAIRIMTEGQ